MCLYFAPNTAENNFKNADFFVDRYALASRLAGQAIGGVGARYRAFEVLFKWRVEAGVASGLFERAGGFQPHPRPRKYFRLRVAPR